MLETGLLTEVDGDDVVVRYADPGHAAAYVGVWAHLRLGDVAMGKVEGGWEVRLSDLPVDRLEYLLDVDGQLRPDPSNPRLTGGPFGDHSWIPLARLRRAGLARRPARAPSERAPLTLSRTGAGRLDAEIWAPADTTTADHFHC